MKFYYYVLERQTKASTSKTVGTAAKESITALVKEIEKEYEGQSPLITFFKEIKEEEARELMEIWKV